VTAEPAAGARSSPAGAEDPPHPLGAERADVCRFARRMLGDGLVVGRSGNVSVRAGDLVAVTPTGVDADALEPDDVPVVDLDGTVVAGRLLPTSELRLHLAAYAADSGRRAVVHTHAPHATAVGLLVDTVPPVHYVLGLLGDEVPVAPYATYGTEELARHAVAALAGRSGCLLRNHGTVAVGGDLAEAYERTVQLEWACRVWLLARAAGEPALLPDGELRQVAAKLRTYGQPREPTAPRTTAPTAPTAPPIPDRGAR
jgi:L-fuculose-phosphate aldolase